LKNIHKGIRLCLLIFLASQIFLVACQQYSSAQGDMFTDVRDIIQKELKRSKVPSISVAVARDGKILWEESFGWADVENKIEATPRTAYSLASISKPITATGLMILLERGLIDLERPADDYLGQAKLTAYHGRAEEATVKRLLHHTAGLPTHWHFFYDNDPYQRPSMDETIRRYGILTAPPGLIYNYSNLGYGILDHIIERVSGVDYPEFMRKEVFGPLGMFDSAVYTEAGPEDKVAQRYLGKKKQLFYDFDHRGASAVYCSAHDLVRFGMFHLKNHLKDQEWILKDTTIELMKSARDPKVPDSNYGLGWSTYHEFGCRFVAHGGGMPGVSTTLTLVPDHNIALVILINGQGANLRRITQTLAAALLPDYAEKLRADKPSSQKSGNPKETPQAFLGTWEGEIQTHAGKVSIRLVFEPGAKVRCRLLGDSEKESAVRAPLGRFDLRDDFFGGGFGLTLPPEDMARHKHHIVLTLKRINDTLVGDAAARSYISIFNLPSYIKLKKIK
jgi:CubicO group peptidase (beta-lactamase class C family)